MKQILAAILALGALACPAAEAPRLASGIAGAPLTGEPIKPIPLQIDLDARKVKLGKKLFHEPRLSHDNTIACANCHDLSKGGADGRPHSFGIQHREGTINTPTVLNSGLNFKQFWDGRASSLEAQIDGPVQAADEMGSSWDEILGKLRADGAYVTAFQEIFGDGVQRENIKNALAEYERSLITPNSRFDQFLRGDSAALSTPEKEGYRKFKSYGCTSCHQGVNIGGNMFETLGAIADYFAVRGKIAQADYGRFNVTGNEEDRFVFKVPSLRNIALTAPYLHDGSAKTLKDAVTVMGTYQLGQPLSAEDLAEIVSFLETLTGELEGKPL